jgi:DhnA family fructose-bisphosphate aldolase class Ia
LIVPIDDSLIAGPVDGLESLEAKVGKILDGRPNGILVFPGTANGPILRNESIPVILNLTTSSRLAIHTKKMLSFSVEYAVRLGADAVAVHVNLTSKYEPEMLQALCTVLLEAEMLGMPVMGIMYPRKEGENRDENYEGLKENDPSAYTKLVSHASRIGMELGVDIIKTYYTGSKESFANVISAAQGVPVLVAGGALVDENQALERAGDVIQAGGSGISYGRNVFSRENTLEFMDKLKKVIYS